MSLSNKGDPTDEKKLSNTRKVTTLNPNAKEFIPFALRSSSGGTSTVDASSRVATSGTRTLGKTVLDLSESSVSNNSDEEAHQYWRCQLPDDITPDFKVMGKDDESRGTNRLPFSSLSLHDDFETSRLSASTGSGFMLNEQQELSTHRINGNSFTEKARYSVSHHGEDPSSACFLHLPAKPWDKQIVNNDQLLTGVREGHRYNRNSRHGFLNDMLKEQAIVENTDLNHLEFLASQFPGFAAESLAEVYFANGGDLNLTIEMLMQLELQFDAGLNQNLNSKASSAPNLSVMDFPALSVPDGQNGLPKFAGDDLQQCVSPYWSLDKDNMLLFKSSNSIPSRGAIDFASAVRKMASQDSGIWKYDKNGSSNASVSSSRSSHLLASSYNSGQGRGIFTDRLQSRGSARAAPFWLETGDAVANMYSEMREEAHDRARLRNAYFEQVILDVYAKFNQTNSLTLIREFGCGIVACEGKRYAREIFMYCFEARQAYLIGNKALAKELSVKGQLHNTHMKAAHGKAQESIYRQRNPVSPERQGNGRGQERIIDLHGLHVSEAIHVLKHELTMLRSAARSAGQCLRVYICVGTGHHTRGSRTPARLPTAVLHYLLEEGLDYSEPQPGLLRVVIY